MPVNIEIKAVVRDVLEFRKRAEEISEIPGKLISQEDIFFRTGRGRLKLRLLASGNTQLIYYERSNEKGPAKGPFAGASGLQALLQLSYSVVFQLSDALGRYLVTLGECLQGGLLLA